MKKLALATAIGLGFGAAGSAHALGTILFDRDGMGGTNPIRVDTITWKADSLLLKGVATTTVDPDTGALNHVINNYVLFGQGVLASYTAFGFSNAGEPGCTPRGGGGSDCNPLPGTEITFVFGVPMKLTSSSTANGSLTADVDGPGFFEIWFDGTPDVDSLAGTGYRFGDAIPILAGEFVTGNQGIDLDLVDNVNDSTDGLRRLDSNGNTDEWDGAPYPAVGTYKTESGSFHLDIHVSSRDPAFFVSDLTLMDVAMDLGGNNDLPFSNTPPSALVAGVAPDFGTDDITGTFHGNSLQGDSVGTRKMNNFECADAGDLPPGGSSTCDLMAEMRGASSSFFNTASVPEPGTLALLGLGLSGLGLALRRRRQPA